MLSSSPGDLRSASLRSGPQDANVELFLHKSAKNDYSQFTITTEPYRLCWKQKLFWVDIF